jgi:hypothetical protein
MGIEWGGQSYKGYGESICTAMNTAITSSSCHSLSCSVPLYVLKPNFIRREALHVNSNREQQLK